MEGIEVTKDKPKEEFLPITIRITEERIAEYLWHILNCSSAVTFKEYCKKQGIDDADSEIGFYFWKDLNYTFKPESRRD